MKPTKLLPAHYALRGSIDLSKSKRLAIGFSIVGSVLFFVFGLLFLYAAIVLVPIPLPISGELHLDFGFIILLLLFLLIQVLVVLLHELTHGAFFWLFTHERPRFGFTRLYAYAAAPNWYIPRTQYIVVGLAPFVLLTLIGLALFPLIPYSVAPAAILALTANAAGSVGDLYIVFRLLFAPSSCLAHDVGDGVAWYEPQEAGEGEETG